MIAIDRLIEASRRVASRRDRPTSPTSLASSVDARAIDGHGRTPLEVAKRAQRDDVVAFLERQDPELAKARQGRESCLATTFGEESAPCSELSCVVA